MTPGPSVQEMIATVRADATSDSTLDQLAAASITVAELEEVADALLAYFVDQCRRSGCSWSEISRALGVTKQAAHKRFSFSTTTLERFTPRARSALRAAAEDARSLGQSYIGTEHILLGLFEPAGGIAARLLGEAGITRARVEELIVIVPPRTSSAGGGSEPPLTPRAGQSIERAVTEALGLGHNYVGTEHLLLALCGDPESLATKILTDLGADRDRFRDRVIEVLSGYTRPQR
jgi:hypothetical protein